MQSGKLRHQVHIQAATKTADAAGTLVETWETVDTVWADIRPVRGREFVQQSQVQGQITHTIQIRYWPGLTGRHRLKHGERVFNLAAPPINVNERNRTHELACEEVI